MANRRVAGILFFKVNGELFQAKGEFTYRVNPTKREMIPGAATIHGFKEEPLVPFIEGAVTDSDELDLVALQQIRDATITLELANEKVIVLREAVYAADGEVTTSEGEVQVRFEGISGEEVR